MELKKKLEEVQSHNEHLKQKAVQHDISHHQKQKSTEHDISHHQKHHNNTVTLSELDSEALEDNQISEQQQPSLRKRTSAIFSKNEESDRSNSSTPISLSRTSSTDSLLGNFSVEEYQKRIEKLNESQAKMLVSLLVEGAVAERSKTIMEAVDMAFVRVYSNLAHDFPSSSSFYPYEFLKGSWKNPQFPNFVDPTRLEVCFLFCCSLIFFFFFFFFFGHRNRHI
jgi:hypothetical protein